MMENDAAKCWSHCQTILTPCFFSGKRSSLFLMDDDDEDFLFIFSCSLEHRSEIA